MVKLVFVVSSQHDFGHLRVCKILVLAEELLPRFLESSEPAPVLLDLVFEELNERVL